MKVEAIGTRKIYGETYTFYLNTPEFEDEIGICGIKIEPYISIETPENCFGYNDTVLFSCGEPYALNRPLGPHVLSELTKTAKRLAKKLPYTIIDLQ